MNELLERYVREVERRLPAKEGKDVARELRSLLAESIDGRAADGDDRESATVAVLEEFGSPAVAAGRYREGKALWIGPELMPVFTRTVAAVLTVLGALAVFGLVWGARGAADPIDALIGGAPDAVAAFISNSLEVLGLLVLVFLGVELISGGRVAERRRWDPRSLPALEDEDRVKRPGLAVGMAVLLLLVAWLTLWPERVGVIGSVDGRWTLLLRPALGFWRLAPWLVAWWCAEVVVDGVVLARGRWTTALRVAELAVKLAGLAVLAVLFLTPDMLALDVAAAVEEGMDPARAEDLARDVIPTLETLLRFGLACGWIASLAAFGKRLVALVGRRD